jgi:hypothetical protein
MTWRRPAAIGVDALAAAGRHVDDRTAVTVEGPPNLHECDVNSIVHGVFMRFDRDRNDARRQLIQRDRTGAPSRHSVRIR